MNADNQHHREFIPCKRSQEDPLECIKLREIFKSSIDSLISALNNMSDAMLNIMEVIEIFSEWLLNLVIGGVYSSSVIRQY